MAMTAPHLKSTFSSFRNLGKTIVLLRELRSMSQAELAKAAGMGKSQVSKYERGKALPNLESLEKILEVLSLKPFDFFHTLAMIDRQEETLLEHLPVQLEPRATVLAQSLLPDRVASALGSVLTGIFGLHAELVATMVDRSMHRSRGREVR